MKKLKTVSVLMLVFCSTIFSSCLSPESSYLLTVAAFNAQNYEMNIEVKKGSVYISGTKNYNTNKDSFATSTDPITFDSIQTNYIQSELVSAGETFSEKINYGYEIIVTVQAAVSEDEVAEIEVTGTDGKAQTYKLEPPLNSKTFIFSNNFKH